MFKKNMVSKLVAAGFSLLASTLTLAAPMDGQIILDPDNAAWLKYHNGGAHFLAAAGDPEDFLYRGELNADGTRSGDQQAIIDKLIASGANGIYFQAIRSHGGDGDFTHNPFNNNDPTQGINTAVLDQWEAWFTQLDEAGVVLYFFFYDDSSRIWNTGDSVGNEEREFIGTLVDKFEHHKHLVWVVAEEYAERFSPERIEAIGSEIRSFDDHDHVISVHKNDGLSFTEFADSSVIKQFAIQFNSKSADEIYAGMAETFETANGRYNLNFSESAEYGNRTEARQKSWAAALGGAYIMVLGMDIANTPDEELSDLGRIVTFMEKTDFNEMSPLPNKVSSQTNYLLGNGNSKFIAYAKNLDGGKIGIQDMQAGTYRLSWMDTVTGNESVQQNVIVTNGTNTFSKPAELGQEVVVSIQPQLTIQPPETPQNVRVNVTPL